MDPLQFLSSAADLFSRHPWVLGAMCGSFGVALVNRWWKRRFSPERGAEGIHRDAKSLYSTEHEYVLATAVEFRFADLSFYDRAERELGTQGFRTLGDWEDVTVSRTYPQMRTFIRQMVSADGSTVASIYHVKIRGWMKLLTFVGMLPVHIRTTDLESEFADGTFLCSSNTFGQDLSSTVTGIERQDMPVATTPEILWATHRWKLAQLRETGGQSLVVIRTAADALALQHRLQALKNRAKQEAGYVDLEQFDRCDGGFGESPQIQQMRTQLARLQAQETSAAR